MKSISVIVGLFLVSIVVAVSANEYANFINVYVETRKIGITLRVDPASQTVGDILKKFKYETSIYGKTMFLYKGGHKLEEGIFIKNAGIKNGDNLTIRDRSGYLFDYSYNY